MTFTELAIPGVWLIQPVRHSDDRGWFSERYTPGPFQERGLPAFIQDNEAMSIARGTVRGLHFQRAPFAQAKLVRCVAGAIHDVALDIRPGSSTFGRHVAVRLDAEAGAQLFIPEGFAHGYCTLEPHTLIHYKVSAPYAPQHEGGVHWMDPALGIDWPVRVADATVAAKDVDLPRFAEAGL